MALEIQFNRIDVGSTLDRKEQSCKVVRAAVFSVGRKRMHDSIR